MAMIEEFFFLQQSFLPTPPPKLIKTCTRCCKFTKTEIQHNPDPKELSWAKGYNEVQSVIWVWTKEVLILTVRSEKFMEKMIFTWSP